MKTIFNVKGKNETFDGVGQQAVKNLVAKYPQFSTLTSRIYFPLILVGFVDNKGNELPKPDFRPHWERRSPKKVA